MIATVVEDREHPYPPVITEVTRPFWDGLKQARFLTTRTPGGTPVFPPRAFDKATWSKDVEWVELSGRGLLYSVTQIHAAPTAFAAEVPYCVAIVDLEEGVRLATRFLGPVTTPLDSPVELVAVQYRDLTTYAARSV
ncbi:OB-fold domain-containing protein [Microbacterium sp. NPDC096154]|uniref:Zn-ribbon domain-containing OB-fold protein n=1 Tax=Microbacterium sp. NPDC096154 TaxID=3155549 RepID=UPI00332DAC7F